MAFKIGGIAFMFGWGRRGGNPEKEGGFEGACVCGCGFEGGWGLEGKNLGVPSIEIEIGFTVDFWYSWGVRARSTGADIGCPVVI